MGEMNITLNGKQRELLSETEVAALLGELGVRPEQVAVAVNGEVVRRSDWAKTVVRDGDAVEVVRAVGGGAV